MISLVFEDFNEKKIRKVIRTEKVRGVIRTESTHICNRCSGSMEGRPSWHWLCYSCWSEIHYGRKAGHGRWYGNETPTRQEKSIEGWIEKKVEVEEEYFEKGQRIAVVNPPKYNVGNKTFNDGFDSLKEAKESLLYEYPFTLHTDEFIKKHLDFFGVNSLKEAIELSKSNKFNITEAKLVKFPKVKIAEHHKKKDFNDMVGYFPNVPAFIQGNPLSMFNRKVITSFTSSVNVYFNMAVNHELSPEAYFIRGQKFFDFLENLTKKNIFVNPKIVYAAHTNNENLFITFKIKKDEWQSEKIILYYMLTNVSFIRLFVLNYLASKQFLSPEWNSGFGHSLSELDLKNTLKQNDENLILSNINTINQFFAT